jgi:hypothetical protein
MISQANFWRERSRTMEVAQTNRSGPILDGRERGKHGGLSHFEGMGRHAGVRLTNK